MFIDCCIKPELSFMCFNCRHAVFAGMDMKWYVYCYILLDCIRIEVTAWLPLSVFFIILCRFNPFFRWFDGRDVITPKCKNRVKMSEIVKNEYLYCNQNGIIDFLALKNLWLDTKITVICQMWNMLHCFVNIGGHLEFLKMLKGAIIAPNRFILRAHLVIKISREKLCTINFKVPPLGNQTIPDFNQ